MASDPAACVAEIGSSNQQSSPDTQHRHSVLQNAHAGIRVPRGMTLTTKRSVVTMAMSVTLGFIVCWMPFYVVSAVRIYSDYQYELKVIKSVSIVLGLSHSVVNPLVYIMFSRRAVLAAFHHLYQRARPRCC